MEEGEVKVVLHFKGERALVGVEQKDADPVLEVVPAASLEEALAGVPALVQRARERWATSPRNPRYQGPPVPAPAPSAAAPSPRTPAPARPARAGAQPGMKPLL